MCRMLNRAIRKFLKQPRIARLATIGRDGYPHIVPIYFMVDGDDIVFASDDDERKVRNARAHPQGAVVIGGEPETDDAGYMVQGDLSIEDHPDRKLLRRLIARYEPKEEVDTLAEEWAEGDVVMIRLTPKSAIRVW